MTKAAVGELEMVVLLAVLQAGDNAYAPTIAEQIEARTGRVVSRGALYVTLGRLVDKGYLGSRLAPPAEGRGGKPRRYYRVTPEGVTAARSARATMRSMWHGLDAVLADS